MTVTAKNKTNAVNLDNSVSSLALPFVGATNDNIVVFVATVSQEVVVASVVDDLGNTYTQRASVFAQNEIDYSEGRYAKAPIYDSGIYEEAWTAVSTGAVTKVTVTLTSGRAFAVAVQSYTGAAHTFGVAGSSALASTSTPSINLVVTAGSWVVAGFASGECLLQAAVTNTTLRQQASAANVAHGVSVAIADSSTVTTGITVAIAPVNQETVSGSTFGVPATYAACAVEVTA